MCSPSCAWAKYFKDILGAKSSILKNTWFFFFSTSLISLWLYYFNCRGMREEESWDISIAFSVSPFSLNYTSFLTTCLKLYQLWSLCLVLFLLTQTFVCKILLRLKVLPLVFRALYHFFQTIFFTTNGIMPKPLLSFQM